MNGYGEESVDAYLAEPWWESGERVPSIAKTGGLGDESDAAVAVTWWNWAQMKRRTVDSAAVVVAVVGSARGGGTGWSGPK